MHTEANDPGHPEQAKRKGILFWLEWVFLSLVGLTFVLVLLIHLPPLQRWGIQKLTASMSQTLNTKVSIERFSIHPVSDLTLHHVFIASPEHPEDTLIYAEKLYVDYKRIWDLLLQRITITQIGIDQGLLNIHKIAGDSLTNLDLALLRILPTKKTGNPDFVLDLRTLNAKSLEVRVDDESSGSLMNIFLKRADLVFDTLNIVGKYIHISELDLDEPRIMMINRLPLAESQTAAAGSDKLWFMDVDYLRLVNGKFLIDNRKKAKTFYPNGRGIDFAHMALEDMDIGMDSLVIRGWDFMGKNIDIHLLHENGFEINKLAALSAHISKDGIVLDALKIKTPDSDISNSISLLFSGYKDFQSFVDSVKLDIPAAAIRLHVNDLLSIVPSLQHVDFFMDNAKNDITIQGNVSGYINKLRIKEMTAGIGPLSLTGDFRSRDLAVKGSQLISLDLKKSAFSADAMKSIFPRMKIPPILNRLGQINFSGKFDGYPDDFVAYGTFQTSLGAVTLDMNLNMAKGLAEGNYSGNIAMIDFDLGTFTGNADLGKISMSGRVIDGKGLTATSLFADITGQLNSLAYKGYTYHNARVDGLIEGKLFSGTMDINDPNIDMHFEGFVDFHDSLPKLDFISKIDSIHFKELGLSSQPITLKGIFDVNLTVGNLDQIAGYLRGEKIALNMKNEDFMLDSLQFIAAIDTVSGDRIYDVNSDVLSGRINGVFDPALLANQLHHYLYAQYPSSISMPEKPLGTEVTQRVAWNFKIRDSENWLDLAGVKEARVKNVSTQGSLNLNERHTSGFIDLPEVHVGGINAYGATIGFTESTGRLDLDLELVAADIKENFFFEDVFIKGTATDDSVRINFKTDQLADIVDNLDLDIAADPEDGIWTIAFNPRRLVMLGEEWKASTGNQLKISKDEFTLDNFELSSKDRKFVLDDINHKGVKVNISGFDIKYLNELWINDKFDFFGVYTLDLEVDNLYNIRQMKADLNLPALQINEVPYGHLVLNAVMNDPKDSVRINLSLQNDLTSLIGEGAYVPPIKSIPKEEQNYLRLGLVATEFPLDFLEFLLGGNIRDTEGSVDLTLSLTGKTNKLNPNGKGRVFNGSTTIDYLGAAYSFHDQPFTITETMIDLSGTKLYDVSGNTAIVEGGLTHRYLRNLGLNATLTSDKIVGLDVTSEENNVFYGVGIGKVFARFSGTVANATMVINTTTAKGTHIYIPLSGGAQSTDKDFVVFLENGLLPVTTTTQINTGGINLTMNMTITEDAIVEIIFDDNTGEVLRGVGKGDLQLSMTRTGDFSMYGNYKISEGDYLFTNFRIVRKPFELVNGGQIQWDGDPYNATLDVKAKYKDLSAPVYTLIQEYLVNATSNVIDQAKERTDVDLTMSLTGSLLKPNIGFDISFPALTGEIKGYADTKIQTLKANENAMFEQVLGLLVTRSFLPSTALNSGLLTKGIDNTLSELISSTLSSYLGGLIGNLIPTGDFLSGISFQMNLDIPITQGGVPDPGGDVQDPSATVVEFALPLEFFNDRLGISVGGNYVTGATTIAATEGFAGDLLLTYRLTPDGRLKIRAYNRNSLTVEGRKNKVGAGLAYQREYDSFPEFLGRKKKSR